MKFDRQCQIYDFGSRVIHQNFPQADTIYCEMSATGQTEAGGMEGEWMCAFGSNPDMAVTAVV